MSASACTESFYFIFYFFLVYILLRRLSFPLSRPMCAPLYLISLVVPVCPCHCVTEWAPWGNLNV